MSAVLVLNAVLAIVVVVGILSLLVWGILSDRSAARRIGSNPVADPTQPGKKRSRATANPTEFANLPITIRLATQDDHSSLAWLAALDSTEEVPAGHVLLGEVDGKLRAALSLSDWSAIADPFHPTAELIKLLRAHGRRAGSRRRNRWPRLRYATS